MARITGIGGVFLKSRNDNKALAAWYQKHLGRPLQAWGGAALRWPDDKADDKGVTAWHVAGPLIQTCGGARRSGEAVARQVAAQLAAK